MNPRSSAFATVVSSHQVGRAAGHAVEVGHGAARVVAAVEERLLLLAICRRYRLTAAATDDVCQTVWLRLVEHLSELDQPAALAGWLKTTTTRECLRAIRIAQRQASLGELVDPEGFDVAADENLTGVDRRLLDEERRRAILTAFDDLDADCRRLLSLLAREPRLSYEEISRELGRPLGSIGPSRLRCLQKLRSHPILAAHIRAENGG